VWRKKVGKAASKPHAKGGRKRTGGKTTKDLSSTNTAECERNWMKKRPQQYFEKCQKRQRSTRRLQKAISTKKKKRILDASGIDWHECSPVRPRENKRKLAADKTLSERTRGIKTRLKGGEEEKNVEERS